MAPLSQWSNSQIRWPIYLLKLPDSQIPMLNVSRLSKSYKLPSTTLPVLRGVDLAIATGESVALTGESGSGKSTLLHLIAGLDDPDSGEITIDEVIVSKLSESGRAKLRRERLGLVFQQYNLIPSL